MHLAPAVITALFSAIVAFFLRLPAGLGLIAGTAAGHPYSSLGEAAPGLAAAAALGLLAGAAVLLLGRARAALAR